MQELLCVVLVTFRHFLASCHKTVCDGHAKYTYKYQIILRYPIWFSEYFCKVPAAL